ncbi:MAG TPA: hypothetical protein VFA08_08805 [Actinomycetota bacterium]|jgi:hypothetical protein|nr:hypothetical protein [Actinomycetota bacterium]
MLRVVQDAVEIGRDSGDVFDQGPETLVGCRVDSTLGVSWPDLGVLFFVHAT